MAYETIVVENRGPVGLVTLDRPKALNALNARVASELDQALAAFDADPDIAAVVLTGSDKAFGCRRRHQGDGGSRLHRCAAERLHRALAGGRCAIASP